MKTRAFVLTIVLLIAVPLSFADDKISIDDIYGTWVNPDYNEKGQYAKWVDHPDGTYELYSVMDYPEPTYTGKETITGSWYDKEGNLWVRWTYLNTVGEFGYGLYKFSDSGKVRESVWSESDYPDEMSPIGGNYSIHYRQE